MTDKKPSTKTPAAELNEEELSKAQGGWSWGESNPGRSGKFKPETKNMERVHEDE